jgi:hypothetical protein
MKTLSTYHLCWLEITKQQRYRDKWLSDEPYFQAIKAQFPTLEALGFNRGRLTSKAISSCEGTTLLDVDTLIFWLQLGLERSTKSIKQWLLVVGSIATSLPGCTLLGKLFFESIISSTLLI